MIFLNYVKYLYKYLNILIIVNIHILICKNIYIHVFIKRKTYQYFLKVNIQLI